jgi:ceramide glucosyltransferase
MWLEIVAGVACLAWYIFIIIVCTVGYVQLSVHNNPFDPDNDDLDADDFSRFRKYFDRDSKPAFSTSLSDAPHVTVIRPAKGLEPYLYECLAATFHQDYPKEKLTIYYCVNSRDDPAFSILRRLLDDYPSFDARIFVENEDPALVQRDGRSPPLGPNPKIRNMSRSYREAKGDLIWIIDANVWVSSNVCGRMVDEICGFSRGGSGKSYSLVHQLPVCVDVDDQLSGAETKGLVNGDLGASHTAGSPRARRSWLSVGGGRLEEAFMSSAHAKFYTAFSAFAVTPCLVGKSNMFRRSHLNRLTRSARNASDKDDSATPQVGEGIDFFSYNICEDQLIGTLIWHKTDMSNPRLGRHRLLSGDLVIQPVANMGVGAYIARRIRWLRVRKFTVMLATFVEPGIECLLCSSYGAFAFTTLDCFKLYLGIPPTWTAFAGFWLLSVSIWALVDWTVYLLLHSGLTIDPHHPNLPPFARPLNKFSRRPFLSWLGSWLVRELLALPIYMQAVWAGNTIVWRDHAFSIGMDSHIREISPEPWKKLLDQQQEQRESSMGNSLPASQDDRPKTRID